MHWHPNPGATLNSQILAEACGCAESLGGTKDGRWKTSIFFYRPIARETAASGAQQQQQAPDVPRELFGVALHERPGLYFSILRNQRIVLQTDAAFPLVMEKLQSYKARVTLNFEVTLLLSFPLSSFFRDVTLMDLGGYHFFVYLIEPVGLNC
jgi:mediator of RNA polymerase II transcription subunit 20